MMLVEFEVTPNELEVSCIGGISRVTKMRSTYPCKFLKVNATDGIFANVCILGFGGGIVSGDCQVMKISVLNKAVLLLKNQGSTKIFKSIDGRYSSQQTAISLSNGSLLALLPDPITCFKGSRHRQHQIYNLEMTASLVLVDWYTCGRKSSGEEWLLDHLLAQLEIDIAGEKVLFEKVDLHATPGIATIAEKVGHASAFGCIVLVGPYTEMVRARSNTIMQRQTFKQKRESAVESGRSEMNSSRRTHKEWIRPFKPLVSVSNLGNNVAIIRFATYSTEDAYKLLADILGPLSKGALHGLPEPYADRINCLSSGKSNAPDVSIAQEGKDFIDEVNSASPKMWGREDCTVVAALRQFDETICAKRHNLVTSEQDMEVANGKEELLKQCPILQ